MYKILQIARIAVIGIAAMTLLGCDAANRKLTSADESEVGPYPAQYKVFARDYLRKTLFDPYSARDAQISKPKPGKLYVEGTLGVHESGWIVCFRGNAKNRMGAYTGTSDTALVIRGDRVLASSSDPSHTNYPIKQICDDEKYDAFPEVTQSPGAR